MFLIEKQMKRSSRIVVCLTVESADQNIRFKVYLIYWLAISGQFSFTLSSHCIRDGIDNKHKQMIVNFCNQWISFRDKINLYMFWRDNVRKSSSLDNEMLQYILDTTLIKRPYHWQNRKKSNEPNGRSTVNVVCCAFVYIPSLGVDPNQVRCWRLTSKATWLSVLLLLVYCLLNEWKSHTDSLRIKTSTI